MMVEIAPDIWVNPDNVTSVEVQKSPASGREWVEISFTGGRTVRLPHGTTVTHVIWTLNRMGDE